jgi:ferredoxin
MRVSVDRDLCIGDGSCVEVCPEVFELRDDGLAYVILDNIPESLRDKVNEAIEICPVEAIRIEED